LAIDPTYDALPTQAERILCETEAAVISNYHFSVKIP
jgi:hypothetical protein